MLNYAFYNASNIASISFKENLYEISNHAFVGTSIEELRFPYSLREIDVCAFADCSKLSKVVIPLFMTYIGENAFPKNSNLTIYARKDKYPYEWAVKEGYNVDEVYTVAYQLNGGTSAVENPDYYIKGDSLNLNTPIKSECTFEGWYTDQNFSNPFIHTAETTGNLSLYAKWSGKNASDVTGEQEPINCSYGYAVTLKKCVYSKDGYTFAGWNTKANGKGTSYADGERVLNLTDKDNETVTLYAQWIKN